MANYKYMRLAEDIKIAVSEIVDQNIDELDFFSVTYVELTKDLGDAKIYFTALTDDKEEYYLRILKDKKNFIKRELSKKVKMRSTPNLIFKYDHSLINYNKIDELLK